MTKPTVRIHDIEANEVIDREMTVEEFADHEAKLIEMAEIKAAVEIKAAEKAALLARLGITDDEAKLLLS